MYTTATREGLPLLLTTLHECWLTLDMLTDAGGAHPGRW